MRALRRLLPPFAALAAGLALAAPADAVVVERVVAVIGDKPILQSELHHRAYFFLLQLASKVPAGPQFAAGQSQIYKELLEKMIDEELQAQAAEKARIVVAADEVDAAIREVAQARGISLADQIADARRSGLTEQDYREEIRRQILEGKMLKLRVQGRVRITEEDVKSMYLRTLQAERKVREFRANWLVLRVPPGSSPAARAERKALAEDLAARVRKGEPFTELARQYSDDPQTRALGGDIGIRAPNGSPQAQQGKRPTLAPEIESHVLPLEPGQVTDPIEVRGGEALVIVQVVERQPSRYTGGFDAVKEEMFNRVKADVIDKARRKWLEELKSRTHLDIRL